MRESWTYKTFGECGSFLRGKSIQKADFVEKGMPCIHYGQIHTKFGISTNQHLSEIPIELYNKSIIASPGDVVIAITSEDLEGSCKSTAWLGKYDIAISAHAAVYKHHLNSKFIAYYLRSKSFYIEKGKYARGFKVMEIKPTDIAKIPIPVPPLSEQEAIVSELDKINELISLKKAQLSDLDNLAQSIFYEMFGDPVENEKGWKVKKLGELADIGDGLHGTPVYSDVFTGHYFINGNNLENGFIVIKSDTKMITEEIKEKYFIPMDDNTILISINGTLGKCAFYRNEDIILGKSACYINLKFNINKIYVFELLTSSFFKDYMSNNSTGTTIRNVSLKTMRTFLFPLPPLSLQQSFAAKIEAIEKQKGQISATIKDLETLLASRMQYWFE